MAYDGEIREEGWEDKCLAWWWWQRRDKVLEVALVAVQAAASCWWGVKRNSSCCLGEKSQPLLLVATFVCGWRMAVVLMEQGARLVAELVADWGADSERGEGRGTRVFLCEWGKWELSFETLTRLMLYWGEFSSKTQLRNLPLCSQILNKKT